MQISKSNPLIYCTSPLFNLKEQEELTNFSSLTKKEFGPNIEYLIKKFRLQNILFDNFNLYSTVQTSRVKFLNFDPKYSTNEIFLFTLFHISNNTINDPF